MEAGAYYHLEAYREVKHGMYLRDKEGEEILMPTKFVPAGITVGSKLDVFVYLDSQDRLVATSQKSKISLYEFAFLRCISLSSFGAFMDWGLDRDLLIPRSEQIGKMEQDKIYLVYLFLDDQGRPTGTTRIEDCTSNDDSDLEVGEEVDLMIYGYTDIGIKVLINEQYSGLLYRDQVQSRLYVGDSTKGYIHRIREDKKVDVSLHRFGYKKVLDNKGRILQALEDSGGFLPLHDKSKPEEIVRRLEISKKIFKKSIGSLYKERKIEILRDGIRLIKR